MSIHSLSNIFSFHHCASIYNFVCSMLSYLSRRSQFLIPQASRSFSTTSRAMAAQTRAGEVISETAKAEGGPEKGSTSAQMQSQVGKTRNFEQAAQEVGEKLRSQPEAVTSEDAAYLKSREARAMGQGQPPADSISAEAQRVASVNEGDTRMPDRSELNPADQSTIDKMENFQEVAQPVAEKMVALHEGH